MNHEWLQSFVIFADHENFTHAARQLHISQPALHVQIRRLGEFIGRPLYQKRGRKIVLTRAGKELAAYGREARRQDEEFLSEIRGEKESGSLVLATGQGALLYLLSRSVKRFPSHRWPLQVETGSSAQVVESVRDARAGVGVTVLNSPATDLVCEELCQIAQLVVVPRKHPLADRNEIKAKDLDGEAIVVAPQGSPHRQMVTQLMGSAGAQWSVAVEATGWEVMMRFAALGLGIAIVNDFCPAPRGMIGIPLKGAPRVTYYTITRKGKRQESVQRLVELIREEVG